MQRQRVRMDAFDRDAPLMFHQQAITHALAASRGAQKQMPTQLVFPDDTMTVGFPPAPLGNRDDTRNNSAENSETEEQRQQRLQNEPVVVYTSLSDLRTLAPKITGIGLASLLCIACQSVCMVTTLSGSSFLDFYSDIDVPTPLQRGMFTGMLVCHCAWLMSVHWRNVDLLKIYGVLMNVFFFLTLLGGLASLCDVATCALCLPIAFLTGTMRHLMMPHCFTVRR